VTCNWLWCTFTTERTSSESSTESYVISEQTISRSCFVNGQRINCSNMEVLDYGRGI